MSTHTYMVNSESELPMPFDDFCKFWLEQERKSDNPCTHVSVSVNTADPADRRYFFSEV